jgi:hypothetical protein
LFTWTIVGELVGLAQFIYDYQTLIAGAGAIAAAYVAAKPVWRQIELSQTQANGVLREMLQERKAEIQQARSASSDKVGTALNELALAVPWEDEGARITEHEAHHHDVGLSQAVRWLRTGYHWRDSSLVENVRETLILRIDDLIRVLRDVHYPAHTEQHDEDHNMSDEEWAAFVKRGEEAKGEVPESLAVAQSSNRHFLDSLEAEKESIGQRLRKVNEALTSQV